MPFQPRAASVAVEKLEGWRCHETPSNHRDNDIKQDYPRLSALGTPGVSNWSYSSLLESNDQE